MFTAKSIPDPKDGWSSWLDRFFRRLEATGYSKRTIKNHQGLLGKFLDYSREARVTTPEAASTSLLAAYLLYRKETPSCRGRKLNPITVNNHMGAVRRFLEFLCKEGVVSPRLVDSVEFVKTGHPLPKDIPSHAEVLRIIDATDPSRAVGFRNRAIIEMLYSTGMRRQEMCDLRIHDVDLERGFARIERGKNGKGRIVPLGRVAAEWVKRYLLAVRPQLTRGVSGDEGWLFVTKLGQKMSGSAVLESVVSARMKAGVEKKITAHALRRACATEMIRHKANPYHVKELLGHEDLRTMDAYVRLTIVDLKEAHRAYHPREQVSDQGEVEEGSPEGSAKKTEPQSPITPPDINRKP